MPQQTDTRERVLTAIRTAHAAPSIATLAAELGLHPNTVRFHLRSLHEEGLVVEERQPTGGRGRPRVAYRTTARGARSGERNYRLLADILVSDLAANSPHPTAAAHTTGRHWGRRLADGYEDYDATLPRFAHEVLAEMGFEPEAQPADEPEQLLLHNCPFRELVDSHQQLVCALHGGMVEALLAGPAHDGPALVPFATPSTCAVRLPPPR